MHFPRRRAPPDPQPAPGRRRAPRRPTRAHLRRSGRRRPHSPIRRHGSRRRRPRPHRHPRPRCPAARRRARQRVGALLAQGAARSSSAPLRGTRRWRAAFLPAWRPCALSGAPTRSTERRPRQASTYTDCPLSHYTLTKDEDWRPVPARRAHQRQPGAVERRRPHARTRARRGRLVVTLDDVADALEQLRAPALHCARDRPRRGLAPSPRRSADMRAALMRDGLRHA